MAAESDSSMTTWAQLAVVAAVAASHMSMPNHWLPYSLVARAHGWSLRTTVALTILGAIGHVTTTIVVSLLISGASSTILSHDAYTNISGAVLFSFGLYYLISHFRGHREPLSCCSSDQQKEPTSPLPKPLSSLEANDTRAVDVTERKDETNGNDGVSRAAAFSVVGLTALSPCVGSMPVLTTMLSPPISFTTIIALWLTLAGSAVGVMVPLVAASFIGVRYAFFARVRRYERLILGIMLVALAAVTIFFDPHHHHHHHHDTHVMKEGKESSHKSCMGGHGHRHEAHAEMNIKTEAVRNPVIVPGGMQVVTQGKRGVFGKYSGAQTGDKGTVKTVNDDEKIAQHDDS